MKRNAAIIALCVCAFVVVLAAVLLFGIFRAPVPIVISKETTVITTPLNQVGFPDFQRHLTELKSKDVTPENNAAVLIWQALWPGELEGQDFVAMCEELGIETIPNEDESLKPVYDGPVFAELESWLGDGQSSDVDAKGVRGNSTEDDAWDEQDETAVVTGEAPPLDADEFVEQLRRRPWTGEQVPPMAQWIESNQKPIDLLIEASKRPRYYSPSPSYLRGEDTLLILTLLPGVNSVRSGVRAINTRAMWHLGEGRPMKAWDDVIANYRLARLVSQGPTLVHLLVAYAVEAMACQNTTTILDSGGLTPQQARQILSDLEALPPMASATESIDTAERLMYVDSVTALATGRQSISDLSGADSPLNVPTGAIDWNRVLRVGNEWYDRLVAAMSIGDRDQRAQALAGIDSDLSALQLSGSSVVSAIFSRKRRSDLMGDIMIQLMLPAIGAVSKATDRTETLLALTRTAAALAVFRAEHGAYPETLNGLTPEILAEVPMDLYANAPFIYERRGNGYLLYSIGENKTDDGGQNRSEEIFNGEWVNPSEGIAWDDNDFVIRLPEPKILLPNQPAKATDN